MAKNKFCFRWGVGLQTERGGGDHERNEGKKQDVKKERGRVRRTGGGGLQIKMERFQSN